MHAVVVWNKTENSAWAVENSPAIFFWFWLYKYLSMCSVLNVPYKLATGIEIDIDIDIPVGYHESTVITLLK